MTKGFRVFLSFCVIAAMPLSAQTVALDSSAPAPQALEASAASAVVATSEGPASTLDNAANLPRLHVPESQPVITRPRLLLVSETAQQAPEKSPAPASTVKVATPWFWAINAALVGASVANTETLHSCVNCSYVPSNLHNRAISFGIGLPIDIGIAYLGYHLKKNGHNWWYAPAAVLTGANAALAAHWAASTK
jgi:hypothetical protein